MHWVRGDVRGARDGRPRRGEFGTACSRGRHRASNRGAKTPGHRASLPRVGVRLVDLLDHDALLRLAGPRSYERGCDYVDWGAVGRIEVSEVQAEAWVQGGERYRVRLFVDGERLGFSCTCPMADQLAFCKHCVALALCCGDVDIANLPGLGELVPGLIELGSERLAELLVEHARGDDRLAQRLHALTLRTDDEVDVAAHRALLDAAIVVRGFVPYGEAWGYFRAIHDALDVLEELLEGDHAEAVVELAEHALRRLEEAIEHVDDSGGGASEAVERLERVHLAACERAGVDGVALAERLLMWELESDWGLFDGAVSKYAGVLGEAGLARYRALARERWAMVPTLGPGDTDDLEHLAIARVMESLAALGGRVEDVVAIRARDLSSGWRFLGIAELFRQQDRHDEALAWAERGLAELPGPPDPRLRAFAVEEYRRRGRAHDALALTAQAFEEQPDLETWTALRRDAEAVGEWQRRRPEALRALTERVDGNEGEQRWSVYRDSSELVRVHLYEGDADLAWQEALAGGCSRKLWLALAQRRRETHPDDALAIFKREVETTIEGRRKEAYAAAVDAMRPVRELLESTGRGDEFVAYIAGVREEHKRKRNLVKLLDAVAVG